MKRSIILLLAAVAPLLAAPACAQKSVTPARAKQMTASINKAASRVRTFKCAFSQVKTMKYLNGSVTSRGRMYYARPDRLRWEYTSPSAYVFIIDGGHVTMKSAHKTSTVDAHGSKIFQSISQIMISSVTGRMLQGNKDFAVTMLDGGKEWLAWLTPKRGDMKKLFRGIRIHFRPSDCSVSKVDIYELNGDTTEVSLSDEKINTPVGGNMFSVR